MADQEMMMVERRDRERFKELRGMFGPRLSGEVDQGSYDTDWQMQLIAAHRLAATKAADERVRVLTEALRCLSNIYPDWPSERMKRIRQLARAALADVGVGEGVC